MINTNIQNPYVIEYCRIRGIGQGEEISNIDYIIWIDNQHSKFQHKHYGQEIFGYDEEYKREFMKYLQGLEAERS